MNEHAAPPELRRPAKRRRQWIVVGVPGDLEDREALFLTTKWSRRPESAGRTAFRLRPPTQVGGCSALLPPLYGEKFVVGRIGQSA